MFLHLPAIYLPSGKLIEVVPAPNRGKCPFKKRRSRKALVDT